MEETDKKIDKNNGEDQKNAPSKKGKKPAKKRKSSGRENESRVNLATMKKSAASEAMAEAAAKKEETGEYTEDNLELKRMSRRERRRAKRERYARNTEGMSKSQKAGYFFYYYKWKLIIGAIIIAAAVTISYTIYRGSRPVAISYAILNSHYPENINGDAFDGYMDYYGYTDKGSQIISSDYSYLDLDTYEEDYAANSSSSIYTSLPTLCYNGYYDIVITDKTGLIYCAAQSFIQPVDEALYPDVYKSVSENYSDSIVTATSSGGNTKEYGIDISGTDFAKSLNLDYDDVYIGFIGISDRNLSNARKFLNYVLDLGLEI